MVTSTDDVDAYPLEWPVGWPRAKNRERARFGVVGVRRNDSGSTWKQRREVTLAEGRDRLLEQLNMMGVANIVISSNARVRKDGGIYSDQRNPDDPGAAVYFRMPDERGNAQPRVLACDKWDRLADNLAALAAHVEALRGIDRWGVGSLAQAFAGYKALTAVGERPRWWQVMGFKQRPGATAAEAKYLELMQKHHPDKGGNPNQAAEINAAWQEGREEMGL
jgi:hypothetical protein